MKSHFLFSVLFLCSAINAHSQNIETILNSRIGNFEPDTVYLLRDLGVLSDIDSKLLGIQVLQKIQNGERIDTLTYRQIIDSLEVFKNKINEETAKANGYGTDSMFIRTPTNEKIFIGLSTITLEKLVQRESHNLPQTYSSKLNDYFSSPTQISETIADAKLDELTAAIFGNVILIKLEAREDISKYKIGDFLEIAHRILETEEFKPFVMSLK
jgi:hypothetical protein